ncbi:MAG: DNA topoisomerase [Hominisplanchenecus sp.]|uniref:DNA topoisomerase n=1 Tax=Hominisplanchenecus sp. TaxID=3038130 RepID=UPI00399B5636
MEQNTCLQRGREERTVQKIQDAHEAIRPTDLTRTPAASRKNLSARDQFRLYQLIWKRFAASRMANAQYTTTSVKIDAAGYRLHVSASKVKFDGFMSVYVQDEEEKRRQIFIVKATGSETSELNLKRF